MMCITFFVTTVLLLVLGVYEAYASSTPIMPISRGGDDSSHELPASIPDVHMRFAGDGEEPETVGIGHDHEDAQLDMLLAATQGEIRMAKEKAELKVDGAKLIREGLQSLQMAIDEAQANTAMVTQGLQRLEVRKQDKRQGTKLVQHGLKSLLDTLEESNKLWGQAEIVIEEHIQAEPAKVSKVPSPAQRDGTQLVKQGLKSILDTLEDSSVLVGKASMAAEMHDVGMEDHREGAKLTKRGLESFLDTLEKSNELANHVAKVTQVLNADMEPNAADKRTTVQREGTKLVKHGLKSALDTLEETNKLVEHASTASDMLQIGMEDKLEGAKLVKRGVKSTLDMLAESQSLIGQASIAIDRFDIGMDGQGEGSKLVKCGLRSTLDTLDQSTKLASQVRSATHMLDEGLDDKQEGTKLVKRGLESALRTLHDAENLAQSAQNVVGLWDTGSSYKQEGKTLIRQGITSMLDALNDSTRMTARFEDQLSSTHEVLKSQGRISDQYAYRMKRMGEL